MTTPARHTRAGRNGELRVCFVSRQEPGITGTSRYVEHLSRGLVAAGIDLIHLSTRPSGSTATALAAGRSVGLDVNTFLAQYPLKLAWPEADVYHLTVQTYASVLVSNPPPGPVAVTVHDIIPYLLRRDRRLNTYRHPLHRLFDWLAMTGLRRADALLADSHWTKQTLVQELGIAEQRITVVHLGVDRERYRRMVVPAEFRQRYDLPAGPPYVLYVGSEDPRKDLESLWRAVALLHRRWPHLQLLKVGAASVAAERRHLVRLANELRIAQLIRFFDRVPEYDLPLFYNVASVCALPSLYEGFGLPVVEALACGTPLVCANTGSLPELVRNGATLAEPSNPKSLAQGIHGVLLGHATTAASDGYHQLTWEATVDASLLVLEKMGV